MAQKMSFVLVVFDYLAPVTLINYRWTQVLSLKSLYIHDYTISDIWTYLKSLLLTALY